MEVNGVSIKHEQDIYLSLNYAKQIMRKLGFSKTGEQKVYVCISELTRNIINHADGCGTFTCKELKEGILIEVEDDGPGISNIQAILKQEAISSKTGLGMGLAGVQRLSDTFHIDSTERGTKIVVIKWRE